MRRVLFVCLPIVAIAVTVAAVAAPSAGGAVGTQDYVAVGDSYSSGTGTRAYDPSSGGCQRSSFAYPALWAQAHSAWSFSFTACSGATTDQLIAGQLGTLSAETDLVTVSIGGNDAGFGPVMVTCQLRGPAACDRAIADAERFIAEQLPARLDAAYAAISQRAGAAEVVVLGYPQLFETGRCVTSIDAGRRTRLNTVADQLAAVTADRATAAGFTFADTRAVFAGHRVCSLDPWLNGPSWPLQESYHPSRLGHAHGFLPLLTALTDAAVARD
ncbi:MAG TPA: SGNH/GDSL hydrolase family protein [Pseudonocardiaceae bacterium]|nr:SGNH/GDSL hydrolase family protein [Pseudonocardiaceae bacterium]